MVYIIAGGPGDPELITVKGQKIINKSDYIFQSSRFLSEKLFDNVDKSCKILDMFEYDYDDKLKLAKEAKENGKIISVVAMGDPALYGMVGGLIDRFEKNDIEFEIISGVNSAFASSAVLRRGFTGLGGTNTFICSSWKDTRDSKLPEKIAQIDATVAFFMSISNLEEIVEIFLRYRPEDTAVAIVSKVSWQEEQVVRGSLKDIVEKHCRTNIEDGLIIIGDILDMEYDYEIERKFYERRRREREC